jgi:hypothetical protein
VYKLCHTRAPIGLAEASNAVISFHLDDTQGKFPAITAVETLVIFMVGGPFRW